MFRLPPPPQPKPNETEQERRIRERTEALHLQRLVNERTDVCFKLAVHSFKSDTFQGNEKSYFENCVKNYVDATQLVVMTLAQKK